MGKLQDKIAIVTGAGTGIGAAVARRFAAAGASLVICGRRPAPLQAVAAQIEAEGGTAVVVTADVARAADVDRVVETAVARFGTVHLLVNNAGIGGGGPIHQHDIATWDQVIAVNLRGPFLMARAVLPLMRRQQSGHILSISSESGLEHYPGDGAYGVSKHALNALGEYIQRENQAHAIRVDTICPGMVVTEMTENATGLNLALCLEPEDVADLAMWLLTRRANIKIGRPLLIQTMANPWSQGDA